MIRTPSANALLSVWAAAWGPETGELVAIADELSRLAEEANDAEGTLQAGWLHYGMWMTLGETARVATLVDEYQALADELKQSSEQWYCAEMRSCWSLFRGAFSDAERLAEEALRLGQRAQVSEADFTYRLVLFVSRREQARLGEIEDLVRRSVDEYAGYRLFRCLLALLRCELGREADARRAFDELARADFGTLPRDIEWVFCLSVLAEVAACIRDRGRAAILYELLLPYARLNAVAAAEVAVGSVARYLGILASTIQQWDDASRHFENALEMNDRMGARPWLAHTQHDYARMLLARNGPGDRHKAQLLLDKALTTYQELGMQAAAASASALTLDSELAAP